MRTQPLERNMDARDKRKLMLISNSFSHGRGYLEHCADDLLDFLGSTRRLVFIPYALADWDGYMKIVREGFDRMGIEVVGIHEGRQAPDYVLKNAKAVFVGGGNTFRLLAYMQRFDLIGALQQRVDDGMPYLGASAGANLAGPTICTTNDMPIMYPDHGFEALDLVPFQINPHYLDPDPNSKHMGETRDQRIKEFLALPENQDRMVVGIREGSWIRVHRWAAHLRGDTGAKLFMRDNVREWDRGIGLTLP